ncbi:hypothetical protein Acy02nite_39570 [Actinoplanes cyaneus]|uniref:DUF4142 domain-containing protein n=1 Tax=Actinoplanes cyaneus TaxID=52696 RepID=A0A919IJ55_9ACTN|nr:DUF4142 domain-containing protein [Actinoplanes cyaneus]MCW2139543.1 putative membrane protein [Actinoplanes cyaneus]GID66076.1 hypothetical protein Acy02nite_39570 [Actinoplanes cyaneus]
MLLRRISTTVGVAGLLALPATAAQAEPSAQDAAFLKAAHQANLAEISAGRIAWTTSNDPTVKTLAATLMRDHIHLDADLYQTARQLRVFLPDAPTEEQQALTRRYEAAGADTFDEYFISTQLAAHRDSLKLVSEQISDGSEQSVKELAADAEPVIAHHRDLLRDAAEAKGLAGYAGTGGRNG